MKPITSQDFDKAYEQPVTAWGDVRIPAQLKALIKQAKAAHTQAPRALELGCGLGRFARYAAGQGLQMTAVDFSAVAIAKASERVADDAVKPHFLVGDVTNLAELSGLFDLSYDVGCFHCLDANGQRAYASELSRLLAPNATHLIWALDQSPSEMDFSPQLIAQVFTDFELVQARPSRRRLMASHWYWLKRK